MNKLGLIAGNGSFPIEVARAARRQAIAVIAVAHRGETLAQLGAEVDQITWIKVGELERMIETLRRAGVTEAAMAGGISRAQLSESFAPDGRALAMLARIGRFSDDAVLRGVAAELEADGIAVIDPAPMLEDALAPGGLIAGPSPSPAQMNDLRTGFRILETLSDFDIGQSVALRDGVVAAIEAVEGTDAALRRAAQVWGPGLVIAKGAKHTQDLRFDRPAIGPATIEVLSEIGAGLLGVQAGIALVLERELTIGRARQSGITLYGYA